MSTGHHTRIYNGATFSSDQLVKVERLSCSCSSPEDWATVDVISSLHQARRFPPRRIDSTPPYTQGKPTTWHSFCNGCAMIYCSEPPALMLTLLDARTYLLSSYPRNCIAYICQLFRWYIQRSSCIYSLAWSNTDTWNSHLLCARLSARVRWYSTATTITPFKPSEEVTVTARFMSPLFGAPTASHQPWPAYHSLSFAH
jgi:hypothetical protein